MLYSFEKLDVYQLSLELVGKVYRLIAKFPSEERDVLCDQLRRSVISVPSNIAEQSGRTSYKERIHFLEIAYGSLFEAFCQLDIASRLGYISKEDLDQLRQEVLVISRKLYNLKYRLNQDLTNKSATP